MQSEGREQAPAAPRPSRLEQAIRAYAWVHASYDGLIELPHEGPSIPEGALPPLAEDYVVSRLVGSAPCARVGTPYELRSLLAHLLVHEGLAEQGFTPAKPFSRYVQRDGSPYPQDRATLFESLLMGAIAALGAAAVYEAQESLMWDVFLAR